MSTHQQALLRKLPSISDLLETDTACAWLEAYPRELVTNCLRDAVADVRRQILDDEAGRCGAVHVTPEYLLELAGPLLKERTRPHIRAAINATGIILHTALGRAVWPESVVDELSAELKGYVSLAIDQGSGGREDRDVQVEYLLTELTGAEAATLANNNAGATLLALAALTAGREVIISRGQLIEIGGAFRLPDVIEQSRAHLVEVGTTNRTHLRDYANAINERTAAILRVHPSNYRVLGFTSEVPAAELAALAHEHNILFIDDLGAGALVDLATYGLPHEPTVQESLANGADLALFSGDKLIGASQAGILVGRRELIARLRKHPLARALRIDKSCLMALERTLFLFRDPARLARDHPTYRMLATPVKTVQERAMSLASALSAVVPSATLDVREGDAYLGSGSLPMERLPSWVVAIRVPGQKPDDLARRLRLDDACVCTRIEHDAVVMDARTITDAQVSLIADAFVRSIS